MEFHTVLHEHDVNFLHVLGLDGENANDFGKQRILIRFKVSLEFFQVSQIQLQFICTHRLDYEFVIVGKEEEGTTTPSAPTRLKHLVFVKLGLERFVDIFWSNFIIILKHVFEDIHFVPGYCHFLVKDHVLVDRFHRYCLFFKNILG